MNVTYYPGCTLRNTAKELDRYAHAAADALGVTLREPDDWQCCGGVFNAVNDDIATKLPAVRALIAARDRGEALVTVCSACHNVIKQTNFAMKNDPEFAAKVNAYLALEDVPPYHGETEVLHFLELLRDKIGFDAVAAKVTNPLNNRKIAAYYGCLLLRPSKVMRMDDPENPQIMEDLVKALGGEAVYFPARNTCCGGYVTLEDPESAKKKSNAVSASAKNHGADAIVTACPLCRYNLEKNGSELPVIYFTELVAEAFGLKEDGNGNK